MPCIVYIIMIHPHYYRLQWKLSKMLPCLTVSNIHLYHYFNTHPATTMRNITHATLQPFCTLHTLRSPSDTPMLKIQQYQCKTHGFHTSRALDPTFGNLPLLTVFPPQLITMPSFCYSRVGVCVCVCFHIMPYANCFGWTVLCVCIEYCI